MDMLVVPASPATPSAGSPGPPRYRPVPQPDGRVVLEGGPGAAPAPPLGPAHAPEAPAGPASSSGGRGGGGARRLLEQSFARRGPPGEGDDGPCGLGASPAADAVVGPRQRSHQQHHQNGHHHHQQQQQHTDHQQQHQSTQQHQQRPKRQKHQHQSQEQQQATGDGTRQQRQRKKQQRPRAQRMAPCSRKMVMHCAHALEQQGRAGLRSMLPAETDGQAIAALKAVTYARALLLSRGGAGLAFQPSAAWGAPQAAAGDGAEGAAAVPTSSASSSSASNRSSSSSSSSSKKARAGRRTSGTGASAPQRSMAFHVAPVDEARMVRFDPAPLIAARAGDARKLAASVAARVAAQGHATLRALGPDATRVALSALVDARRQLRRRGCDFAVLPARHVGASGRGGGAPEGGGGGSWEEDEEDEAQMLTSVSLHIVRCAPAAPGSPAAAWQLQPWPLGAPAPRAAAGAAALPATAAAAGQAEAAPVPTAAAGNGGASAVGKARAPVGSPGTAPKLAAPLLPPAAPRARAVPSRPPAAGAAPPAGGPAEWPSSSPLPAPA